MIDILICNFIKPNEEEKAFRLLEKARILLQTIMPVYPITEKTFYLYKENNDTEFGYFINLEERLIIKILKEVESVKENKKQLSKEIAYKIVDQPIELYENDYINCQKVIRGIKSAEIEEHHYLGNLFIMAIERKIKEGFFELDNSLLNENYISNSFNKEPLKVLIKKYI